MAANFLEKCPTLPHLIAGAKEILEYCSHRYKMHIITNGFKEVQEIKMTSSGIIHYFQHFFYSEDLGVKKPHPAIFRNALNISQCSAEEVLMIGDDWGADILGARNIGIDQVYLNTNNKLDRRHNYTPTYSINDLRNLKEIL
jgi:putative hydrolase of the HAD superfamily